MANYLICHDPIDPVSLHCPSGWVVTDHYDFQSLVALLQFDPEICAYLIGTCVLFFVIGHAAGKTARIMSR